MDKILEVVLQEMTYAFEAKGQFVSPEHFLGALRCEYLEVEEKIKNHTMNTPAGFYEALQIAGICLRYVATLGNHETIKREQDKRWSVII